MTQTVDSKKKNSTKKSSKKSSGLTEKLRNFQNTEEFRDLHWEGSFDDYLRLVKKDPSIIRNAFQRIYDMIMESGSETYIDSKKEMTRYHFFSAKQFDGNDAIFGLDISLMRLVNFFKSAAMGYGTEKRVLLLHGPVGSAKSTIARLLKKGLEKYSRASQGAQYTFFWDIPRENEPDIFPSGREIMPCPMHEEPLNLIPKDLRKEFLGSIGIENIDYRTNLKHELCPACRFVFNELLEKHDGDLVEVLSHIRVKRLILSEQDRIGIGTFQPKDEKNQDSTELTGDINYRKIAIYGSDSDPRAFNFDGEFNISNRGIIEFVEMLKLDVAFLYDLLGASQEHKIKPKKFAQTDIDLVILGHTNEAEYKKLINNEFMEALRDRTIKIDIPYVTRLQQEVQIYKRDFNQEKIRGKHIAPHTLEMAGMWAILTRLEEPKTANLTLLQKLKLYDGKSLPGFTEDNVKEQRKSAKREGMEGMSPRYVQDKISNALVANTGNYVNPFMIFKELGSGLRHHSLITNEDQRKHYLELLDIVKQEYEDIIKNEVQRAISADEDAIAKLCANYIDNIKAYTQRERVKNPFTGQYEEPDERLMRSIEEKIDVAPSRKDDFRREIMNYIGALAVEGKTFDYKTNERLHKALELKLFEDQKDTIRLTSLISNVIDKSTQEKIDIVRARLIRDYGYSEESASDVLIYVASIFARGDVKG